MADRFNKTGKKTAKEDLPLIKRDIVIVGAGPAGAFLGKLLKKSGYSFALIDKFEFPREKACAGWITPDVLKMLDLDEKNFPIPIKKMKKLIFFVKGKKIAIPTHQYAIRRYEFDNYLIKMAGKENFYKHEVKKIEKKENGFLIDDKFEAKMIIGAGGTYCPVYRKFFANTGFIERGERIIAMEEEFKCDCYDKNAYLWFFENGLSGYSWYLPKKDGFLNVGIGGKFEVLKAKGETIKEHWDFFIQKLERMGLVPKRKWSPKAHQYHLIGRVKKVENDGAYIVGDSLGVSTIDMGEGISNSMRSSYQLFKSLKKVEIFKPKLKKYSLLRIIFPFFA